MKRIHGPMAGRTVLILVPGAASGIGRATVLGLAVADLSSRGKCGGWRARYSSGCGESMCWSTTSAGTGAPATSPWTGWNAPLRSYDQAVAARLWEASSDLVSLTAAPRV